MIKLGRPRRQMCKRGHEFQEGSFWLHQRQPTVDGVTYLPKRTCKLCNAVRARKFHKKLKAMKRKGITCIPSIQCS